MGFVPPSPGGIAALLELIKSPRVKLGAGEFQRAAGMAGGPFSTNTPVTAPPRGASLNTGSMFAKHGGSQGEALGAGLGNIISQLGQQQQQDPLMDLYNQLLNNLQQPVNMPTGIDKEDLMNQVRAALDPIYDQRAAKAEGTSKRGRADVSQMYRALSNDYERLAPEQAAQAAEAQKQVESMYGQLRSNVQGDFSRVSEEQGELFKKLGIESALPDVLQDQAAPVQDTLAAASENQAQQAQRYMDIGQMDQTYYREGSPNATLQGNNIQTDMLDQLSDYLSQNEAERTSGIQSGYMDQLGQAQNSLQQQQQNAISQQNNNQQMLWQMLQSQLSARSSGQQAALTPDTYLSQLDPQAQQSVAGAFSQLQRSPEAVYGKVEDKRNPVPGTFVETTPEWYLAQADQMLQQGQIDPATHAQLLQFIQLYYGMGK